MNVRGLRKARRAQGASWLLGVLAALTHAPAHARAQPAPLPSCTGTDPQTWHQCLGTWEDRARDFFYAGEFRNGRPSGLGLMRTGSSLYAGEFLDGRVHGQGVLTFLGDRSKYVGEFREGAMHGRGAVVRADGSVVQSGQYEAGVLRQPDPPAVVARPATTPLPALPGPATAPLSPPAAAPAPAGAAPAGPAPATAPRPPVPAAAPSPGFAVGRVTMPDGGPLTGDVKDVAIGLYGISAAGERVSYGPEVGTDGRYRQRVAPGQYRFGGSQLTVRLGEREFRLPLEPVGERWSRNRDAAEGLVQDFVWKTTGLTPYGRSSGPDESNHTHWYGVHVRATWQTWRADTRKPTVPPPPGTKLRFTIRPVSPTVDGQRLEPFVVERDWDPRKGNKDLNDLPPADLEITGVALLPDGSSKPMLLQGTGDYPNFKPALRVPLTRASGASGTYAGMNAGWVLD